jgi:hypothetical protein
MSERSPEVTRPPDWRSLVYYRLRQFFSGVVAQVSTVETQAIEQLLPVAALILFRQMPVDAQRHSLNVLHSLQTTGRVHPALAIAALLHDVGKLAAIQAGIGLTLWWRGPLVLLETFAPSLFYRLAHADPASGWRYLIYVQREHPRIGADWAKKAGCPPLACWLIEHHQQKGLLAASQLEQELLAALQWADGKN